MNATYVNKWDLRFLDMAKTIASWSKDPSTKVGAVITDTNRRIISLGFNGLPQGVVDTDERYQNRGIKYKLIIHAEMNAMIFASGSLQECILYTWPFPPCSRCAGVIVQHGIRTVIAPKPSAEIEERWHDDMVLAKEMFAESAVDYIIIPTESLL